MSSSRGDLGDALELAGKLAARSGDAQILVATDGALATPVAGAASVPAKVTVLPVGRERKNQAIVALAVRTAPSAVTRSVFVSVANLDLERAARRLEVWGDGGLIEVRDLQLDPQARSDVVIDDVPRDVATLELRLVGADPAATGAPDQLAVDDHAWAVIPPDRPREILVVGEGDPYLETALTLPAERAPVRHPPDRVSGQGRARRTAPAGTSIIFEGAAAGDPAANADPRHRPDRHEPARRPSPGRSPTPASARSTRPSRSSATSTCRRPTSPRPPS